ncbi:unnamed protein product [Urochloa humidicola]
MAHCMPYRKREEYKHFISIALRSHVRVMEDVNDHIDVGMSMYLVQSQCDALLQIWRMCHPLWVYGEDEEDEKLSEPELDSESTVANTMMIRLYKVD